MNADAWNELDAIHARAHEPHPQDGARVLALAAQLGISIDQLKTSAELAGRAGKIRSELVTAEKRLLEREEITRKAEALALTARLAVAKAQAERERIMLDVPAELVSARHVIAAAVAVADQGGTARCQYLASLGWQQTPFGWAKQNGASLTNESAALAELRTAIARFVTPVADELARQTAEREVLAIA